MARPTNKLTATEVKNETRPGRHSDGGGLFLQVKQTGSKAWVFMWKEGGKRTVMGLGSYPAVSLADAREKRDACNKQVAKGLNPLVESRRDAGPTFAVAVERFLDDQRLALWRNDKHKAQWKMTLGKAYCTAILDKKVDDIHTAEVLKVLKPVWQTRGETASRLRGRIERVLAFAEAQGWRPEGKNPAQWKNNLDAILPRRKRTAATRNHHRAMPYADMPEFVGKLRKSSGVASLALEFAILTAARSGEAFAARWDEVDFEKKLWTVPPERMKAGEQHEVPLSPRALEILTLMASLRQEDGYELVFPGQRSTKTRTEERPPVRSGAVDKLLARLKVAEIATTHGFRSSFRDWAGDETTFPREVAEAALAHAVGNTTERSYRRATALAKRRKLMEAWANYLNNDTSKVIDIGERRQQAAKA